MSSRQGNFLTNPVYKTTAFQFVQGARMPFQEKNQNIYNGNASNVKSKGLAVPEAENAPFKPEILGDAAKNAIPGKYPAGDDKHRIMKQKIPFKENKLKKDSIPQKKAMKYENQRKEGFKAPANEINKKKASRFTFRKQSQNMKSEVPLAQRNKDYFMIDYFNIDDYTVNDDDDSASMVTASPTSVLEMSIDCLPEERDFTQELYEDMLDCMFKNESHLKPQVRGIINDWFVEVAAEFEITTDSIFFATNYFDRFLVEKSEIRRSELQLYGIACLILGAKMDDRKAPLVSDYADITGRAFTEDQIIAVEEKVVNVLEFNMVSDPITAFIRMFLKEEDDEKVAKMAEYFAFLSLLDYSFMRIKPSVMAAACISAAKFNLGLPIWNHCQEKVSRCTPNDVHTHVASLHELHRKMYNKEMKLANIATWFNTRDNYYVSRVAPKMFNPRLADFESIL